MNYTFIDILNADASNIRKLFETLDHSGILAEVLPELVALKGVDKSKETFHKDNFYHTLQVIENTYNATTNPWLRLVAILHDIGKAKTKKWVNGIGWTFHNHEYVSGKMLKPIFKRLNLPEDRYEYVYKLIINHGFPKELSKNVTASALRRFALEIGDELDDLILFCKCDLTSSKLDKKARQSKGYDDVYNAIIKIKEQDEIAKWRCPIDGIMIMEHFGVKGKEVGIIKTKIETAIKNGQIEDNYDAAFEYMKTIKL